MIEHNLDQRLARARGNGSGLRIEPHEVETIIEWKRKAEKIWGDANSLTSSLAISQGLDGVR